jgi:putative flippase GtrA
MSRRVITRQLQNLQSQKLDTYFDRVIKYIPADIVAAWVAVVGIVKSGATGTSAALALWIAFVFGAILTAIWTWKQTSVAGLPAVPKQILISSVAFIVWVFALGGPQFDGLTWYNPMYGSLLLIAYTLIVGLFDP